MAPTSFFALLATLIALSTSTRAVPTVSTHLPRQDAITPVDRAQIAAFKPYTWFAAAANCNASTTVDWSCGEKCDANPGFKPVASGGDGIVTQFWYVGYDPALDEIIVGHQGTDFSKIIPLITDLLIKQVPLDSDLFPGIEQSVKVHQGFAGTQSRSAPGIVAAVNEALSAYPTRNVTVVGHSLGAAIALLDAVYLPLHLPSDVTVRYVGYASPRVGNQAFADYVDAQAMSVTRVNNKKDPVPVLPTIELFNYHHASGEIHIRDDDVWVSCPGQDNPSAQCSTGAVNLLNWNASQHLGPYDGVMIGGC
ncbi:alpha/beta-hydrolase [Ganoderma leucocontextum]|nr:alpha/beta-hydrolase [Ganoderma leucocontextum]